MTSKTKALKKGTYTPGNATPAPVKAENKATRVASTNHYTRDLKKEIEARARARRIRSLMKQNIPKEQIEEWMHEENNRFVLCLIYNSFCVKDGDKNLYGIKAFEKFCKDNKLNVMSTHKGSVLAGWILSDKDNVEAVTKLLTTVGRTSITKPELRAVSKKKKTKKPTNNTSKAKKSAKEVRKASKQEAAKMRPYYAALRKGGVSTRIKKYNKTLAEKIEAWIKEKKKHDAEMAEKDKEYRAKHRQLTSLEMKANKRARKAAKHLAAQERHRAQEKKQMENNTIEREKRAQKAKKPVQTELNMAAQL